jgi:hypothetical protein
VIQSICLITFLFWCGGLGIIYGVFFVITVRGEQAVRLSPMATVNSFGKLVESHPYNSSYKVRVVSSPYVHDPVYLALVMVAKGHLNVVYLNQ